MKFFPIERIKQAIDHLALYKSPWVIVPLLFAVNGVDAVNYTKLTGTGKTGTDSGFLASHFSGSALGLPDIKPGHNAARPKFRDIRIPTGDYIKRERQLIWANAMSRYGYRPMDDRGLIAKDDAGGFRLNAGFQQEFETELTGFHFEELLVWLYAFGGFPDQVNGWQDLFTTFVETYRGENANLEPQYTGKFKVGNGVPWPTGLLADRPSNEAFQRELMPSVYGGLDLGAFCAAFERDLSDAGALFSPALLSRLVASLLTKRFLILTGLSGSGKTKAALALAQWLATSDSQWVLISVGPDWTSNENVLGYADALDTTRYCRTPALDLILRAATDPDSPYFLILDEMNLSHVERYFADILSAIESDESIHLHGDRDEQGRPVDRAGVPPSVTLPPNLFIVGTVNIDETTYMFSPKVLDRANVIEFAVSTQEMAQFLQDPGPIDLSSLCGQGRQFAPGFLATAETVPLLRNDLSQKAREEVMLFFEVLKRNGTEFGYRTAKEISRFIALHQSALGTGSDFRLSMDAQIAQKILPKLHGSRRSLEPVLWALSAVCHSEHVWTANPASGEQVLQNKADLVDLAAKAASLEPSLSPFHVENGNPKYPVDAAHYTLSSAKIRRMLELLERNGFASFAEA